MQLYDSNIKQIKELLAYTAPAAYPYKAENAWPEHKDFTLIMQRDQAFELGSGRNAAVNVTMVTSTSALVEKDEVLVYGPELKDLKEGSPYARIALIRVGDIESDDEDDTETAFRAIQDIDFVKYHIFPEGYMIRTSAESGREQVRVSKDAVKKGISFERIGTAFIKRYKENINVLAAKVIFITDPNFDYSALQMQGRAAKDITMSLSKILEGMPTDCGSCNLKPICDEVEGMRELHFGKKEE